LRYEHSERRVALFGLEPGSELRRILDADGGVVPVPREGTVLTAKLAEILGVETGDELQIEVLEQGRPVRKVRVAGVANELIGLNAYMDAGALHRLMREGDSLSGAFLRVDAAASATLNAELKRMPAVAGATTRLAALRGFEETLARSLDVFTTVLVTFAAVIAAAMVYNAARIALSERGRELASLRVLGFTRGEVSVLLLGEQAILTALAIPLGFAIGYRSAPRQRALHGSSSGAARGEYAHLRLRRPCLVGARPHSRYGGGSTASTWWQLKTRMRR
jgi:putative ABC transport system permease protein